MTHPGPDADSPKSEPWAALAVAAVDEINRLRGTRFSPDAETTIKACRKLARKRVTPDRLVAAIRRIALGNGKDGGWLKVPHLVERVCPETLLQVDRVLGALENIDGTTTQGSLSSIVDTTTTSTPIEIEFDDGTTVEAPR